MIERCEGFRVFRGVRGVRGSGRERSAGEGAGSVARWNVDGWRPRGCSLFTVRDSRFGYGIGRPRCLLCSILLVPAPSRPIFASGARHGSCGCSVSWCGGWHYGYGVVWVLFLVVSSCVTLLSCCIVGLACRSPFFCLPYPKSSSALCHASRARSWVTFSL